MNKNEIIGVRYIGKKDRQEDTVCKTGAVWLPGQVHNFSGALASLLLAHTDSFERAPAALEGGTFLSSAKAGKSQVRDVAAYANISNMKVDQLVHFARRELDRVVSADGKSEDQVRREVHSLMMNHNLDVEAQRISQEQAEEEGLTPYPYMATKEEIEALRAGLVVLAIIPAEVAEKLDSQDAGNKEDAPIGPQESGSDETATPSLEELLARLEKPELLAFARQESVAISNSMTAEKLREKIFADLSARQKPE